MIYTRMLSRLAIVSALLVLCVPSSYAQDLSKYRNFSFGMSAAAISKLAGQTPRDLVVIHKQPTLLQELTWYPPRPFEPSQPGEPVEKVLFSFDNGELYRMVVIYSGDAVKGLTNEDMVRILSAKYGVGTRPVAEVQFPTSDLYTAPEKVIARWEDAQYSLSLFRSAMSETYGLVMVTKQEDAQAAASIVEAIKLEALEAPGVEAARVKQVAVDLETDRQKNIKTLRP